MKRTRVKMCGFTRAEDIQQAIDAGVDAIGFVFYTKSPRYIELALAQQLSQNWPIFVNLVALFVNPDPLYVKQVIEMLPVNVLQFHGHENEQFCHSFGMPWIKAVHVAEDTQLDLMCTQYTSANAILFDTATDNYGGSGRVHDWHKIPKAMQPKCILSGGLSPNNVREAIRLVNPYAVDVSSGIEREPGVKDALLIQQFIKQIRVADND